MSFPRAKIHRFNDVQTDAPSPTRYDPKSADKAKGCTINKGERERTMSSTSDTHSTGGTPFRTPYSVVKKHSCLASHEKPDKTLVARGMIFAEPGVTPLISVHSEEEILRSELASKTHEISEFKKLVDDLSDQVRSVEDERSELFSRVTALEAAKADLECLVSNNVNCEAQIKELTGKLSELHQQLECLTMEKNELVEKCAQGEQKISKLEDGNVEYEKRIISLEGTLEQVTMEYNEKVEQVRVLKEQAEKLQTTIECLQGKIEALETEVGNLEAFRSQNEETIFGLEERASALNFSLESARAAAQHQQEALEKLEAEIEERKIACSRHEDTITGLDMQLEARQKEFVKLSTELENLVAANNSMKEAHQVEIEQLRTELTEQLLLKKNEIDGILEEKKALTKAHEEELFLLQNEWEKKILSQMQEAEQALLEKDAVMKLADLKNQRLLGEARDEWERQLRDAEEEASRRQSAQLEAGEMMKARYEARIADLDATIAQVLEEKGIEAAIEKERYREVCEELSAQIETVKAKELEITQLMSSNMKTTARLNNMLEEVKLLNAENAAKTKEIEDLSNKFNEERKKNEKLSEHLGELDSEMATLTEELKNKYQNAKDESNAMKMKNVELQLSIISHKDTASTLAAELEASRISFNAQLMEVTADLTNVKQQCRKFEIVMSDTRRSLEALGHRLIESENEVERLNKENEMTREKLAAAENDKNDADHNYRSLMDVKIDLEQRIVAAEAVEQILRQQIKELELKNCDLELTKNELQILKETLEEDKTAYETSLKNLSDVVKGQNLKMIELERASLDQIEAVSQVLMIKLDEFQKFSTAKIQQLNLEVRRLEQEKLAINNAYEEKCEEFDTLFTDHDILKTTFDITIKENQSVKTNHEEQINSLKAEVKEYQSKLLKNMDEVSSLLFNFEAEHKNVEQLEENRKNLLATIQELEETINLQREDLTAQLGNAKCEIDNLNSKILSADEDYKREVEKLREELAAAKDGGDWKVKWELSLEEKEHLSAELLSMTDKKDRYKFHCQRLEKQLADATTDCDDAVKDFDKIHSLLKGKESEVEQLQKRINDLESLIGPFREQLELYETERMMLENDREQLRKQHLEQAAKLGHQNHKQKIQHVVKLKNDILELRKENQKLQFDLKQKNKQIEHLREEVGEHPKRLFLNGKRPSSTPFKGKENDGRMSPISGLKQEPMSPSNPLKDRNF